MRMALTLMLAAAGVLLLPQYTWAGIGLLALSYLANRATTARDEETFIGCLMVLGGLGALAVVAQFITARL